MVMSSEQLSRWLKNRIRVKAAKFVAVLGLEVSIREGPPSDLTPVFWPGSHKLQRGGVLGFIFGWRQHIQG